MRRTALVIILTFASLLAACAPNANATPALIGAYVPHSGQPLPTAAPPAAWQVVYTADLALEVADVGDAVNAAYHLAERHGGYASRLESGYVGADLNAWATLVVPLSEYDNVRAGLLALGALLPSGEQTTSQLAPAGSRPADSVTFAIHFLPAAWPAPLPAAPQPEPHLAQTVRSALTVSIALFTFLADAAIWLIVVGGPFVLLALGLRRLFRRAPIVSPAPIAQEEKKE